MNEKNSLKLDKTVKRLKASMAALNLSPEEASGFLGVSYRSIYRWLNGEFRPSRLSRRAVRNGIRRMEKLKRDRSEAD